MEKKIVCYDIDGTLTTEMLFVPLVIAEHDNAILSDSSYANILETLRAFKSGEILYEDAAQLLLEKHAKGLAGKNIDLVAKHAVNFVRIHTELFRPFGTMIINALKNDALQFAVTAEPQYVADAVANYLGLDGAYSSVYETAGNQYTGNITSSLAHRNQKAEILSHYIVFSAFGDSEGDIDMLANSRHAFCISPTDGLKHEAELRGWQILEGIEADSESILNILGLDSKSEQQ